VFVPVHGIHPRATNSSHRLPRKLTSLLLLVIYQTARPAICGGGTKNRAPRALPRLEEQIATSGEIEDHGKANLVLKCARIQGYRSSDWLPKK